jgi:hypothetical protein
MSSVIERAVFVWARQSSGYEGCRGVSERRVIGTSVPWEGTQEIACTFIATTRFASQHRLRWKLGSLADQGPQRGLWLGRPKVKVGPGQVLETVKKLLRRGVLKISSFLLYPFHSKQSEYHHHR